MKAWALVVSIREVRQIRGFKFLDHLIARLTSPEARVLLLLSKSRLFRILSLLRGLQLLTLPVALLDSSLAVAEPR